MSDDPPEFPAEATLYNPPEEGEEVAVSRETEEELQLEISEDLATRLLEVAVHLGLTPSMVASRAIDLVCEEVGLVQDQDLSSSTLIQKYQTRLDLLHHLDYDVKTEDKVQSRDEFSWEQVDEIIRTGEEASG